jgi:hypothetical protein
MKKLNKHKIIKVKCDFCGKDMECPEYMLNTSDGHMCHTCYQNPENLKISKKKGFKNVHIDMPVVDYSDSIAGNFADTMVEDVFKEIWSEKKKELKDLSKKKLSEEMFGAGVYLGIKAFIDSINDNEKIENVNIKK